MKLIINCELDDMADALALAAEELAGFAKYTKIGWGWGFGRYDAATGRCRFFARRLRDGLSITGPHPPKGAQSVGELREAEGEPPQILPTRGGSAGPGIGEAGR